MSDILTHIDSSGFASMVDVSEKKETVRTAKAHGLIYFGDSILASIGSLLEEKDVTTKKGPVFQIARIAGIAAAKKTSETIPLCHGINLEKVQIDIIYLRELKAVKVNSEVKTSGKTGVEMEALVAVSTTLLTIYDMLKALGHDMRIEGIELLSKSGGKSDISKPSL